MLMTSVGHQAMKLASWKASEAKWFKNAPIKMCQAIIEEGRLSSLVSRVIVVCDSLLRQKYLGP